MSVTQIIQELLGNRGDKPHVVCYVALVIQVLKAPFYLFQLVTLFSTSFAILLDMELWQASCYKNISHVTAQNDYLKSCILTLQVRKCIHDLMDA